jgi:undecaprenyl-diphosphatase
MNSLALAASLLLVLRGRLRRVVAGVAVILLPLIGLSRVWLGAHFPTDVVAGWALSLAWVSLVAIVLTPGISVSLAALVRGGSHRHQDHTPA